MKQELAKAAIILKKVRQPVVPNEVITLQEESMKPEPDVLVIAKCISRNPKLLTKFLGIATYITKGEVRNAQEAVEILGTQNIFNLFFSSAIEFSLQGTDHSNTLIINHAIKIAVAMSELSRSVKDIHAGDAYLYGLLYNIGHVVLNSYDHRFYKSIFLDCLFDPKIGKQKELDTYGTTSSYIGVYVAKRWHVKNSLYSGILFQDQEIEKCQEGVNLAFEMVNLLNIARAAVAQTENERFVTEAIRENATQSMQKLGIGNKTFLMAQKRIRSLTEDLGIVPEDYLKEEDQDEIPNIKLNSASA